MSVEESVPEDSCVHCHEQIFLRGSGNWVHHHGLGRCQSRVVPYGHLAHPASVPCRAEQPNPCLGALS